MDDRVKGVSVARVSTVLREKKKRKKMKRKVKEETIDTLTNFTSSTFFSCRVNRAELV